VANDSYNPRRPRGAKPTDSLHVPSLLGLSDRQEASSDLDYLYEEEEKPRTGVRRLLAIIVLIGFLGGISYLWKQHPDWITSVLGRVTAIASPAKAPPAPDSSPPAGPNHAAVTGTTAQIPPPEPGGDNSSQSAAENSALPQHATTPDAGSVATKDSTGAEAPPAATPVAVPPAPTTTVAPPVANRRMSSSPEPPSADAALLDKAEAYLYGHGTRQSCSQALVYLRTAADHGSAKARSQLGGLYATGHCVSLDRATAYNWFTLAAEAGERNVWVERNREMLWAQMSPSERQRVSGH
jgi:hypothetical protein